MFKNLDLQTKNILDSIGLDKIINYLSFSTLNSPDLSVEIIKETIDSLIKNILISQSSLQVAEKNILEIITHLNDKAYTNELIDVLIKALKSFQTFNVEQVINKLQSKNIIEGE